MKHQKLLVRYFYHSVLSFLLWTLFTVKTLSIAQDGSVLAMFFAGTGLFEVISNWGYYHKSILTEIKNFI